MALKSRPKFVPIIFLFVISLLVNTYGQHGTSSGRLHNGNQHNSTYPSPKQVSKEQVTNPIVLLSHSYVQEFDRNFEKVETHDNSTEQRLANLVGTYREREVFYIDFDEFNSGNKQEDANNELLVAGPKVDDRVCGQHLDQMLQLMHEMQQISNGNKSVRYQDRHLRMARLLDSFGHYESGYMSGRMYSFGSYDQCRNTQLELNSAGEEAQKLTRTRYCWAKLSLDEYSSQELQRNNQNDSHKYPLRVAICLPESCHSRSINTYRHQLETILFSQFRLPSPMYVQREPRLESIFCTVDENSQVGIPTDGKVLLALLALWFGLLIWATFCRSQSTNCMSCLDMKTSWAEFVCKDQQTDGDHQYRRVELNCLNPVRWLCCTFVIYAHVVLTKVSYGANEVAYLHKMETEIYGTFVLIASVCVDTFFVISGILLTFIIMKKANRPREPKPAAEKQRPPSPLVLQFVSSVYQIVKARYLRLAPLLLLVYWFKRSVFTYLGSGPMWDFGFNKDTLYGGCQRESWLVPVTFGSAFLPLSRQCLLQSWSVSSDMFFVLVFAPIILVMTRNPKVAGLIVLNLCMISNIWMFVDWRNSPAMDAMKELMVQGIAGLMKQNSHFYTFPMYRLSSYAVGVGAGFLLYHYEKGEHIKQWSWYLRGPVTWLSLYYINAHFVVISNEAILKPHLRGYHGWMLEYSLTLGRVVYAGANSVLFLRMMTDWKDSHLMRFSAGPLWRSLSKLAYAMLLVHMDLVIYDALITPQASLVTHWTIFQTFSSVYLASILLSTVIFVAIENPIDKLVKRVIL